MRKCSADRSQECQMADSSLGTIPCPVIPQGPGTMWLMGRKAPLAHRVPNHHLQRLLIGPMTYVNLWLVIVSITGFFH